MNASSAFPSLSHAPQRLATALALIAIQANLAADAPPKAPERPVTNAYFGVKVTDPYRWMEADGSLGSTAAQAEAEWTDNFSFLFWQTGDPEFQPHER